MAGRMEIEQLLRELYAARVRGDLDGVCRAFSSDASLQIAGAGNVSPIGVKSIGIAQFRPLLGLIIKSFKLSEHTVLSILVDGEKAAVHWQAKVHSKITGTMVLTEFVDLVEVGDHRINSYTEFFVPRSLPSKAATGSHP
jgi:ketosteroid isomerase-like protein